MTEISANAVVGQSGGPTSAINATLSGVIRGMKDAVACGLFGKIYGMKNGIEGFLEERLVDLSDMTEDNLSLLEMTPAAALGSCRLRLPAEGKNPDMYEKILGVLRKYNIRAFFYIGGNDSMDTVLKLSDYTKKHGYDLRVVGVPKTIDNDLTATDHTPGFGSAAKYIASSVKEMLRDIAVYTVRAVTIVEIMGRDAGWLTTAAALSGVSDGRAPDLIYLPEHPFSDERFLSDVRAALERRPDVMIAVSEGIRYADGTYVSAGNRSHTDAFGHVQLAGAGKALEELVRYHIGCKVRSVELNLPQRCAAHLSSLTDIRESVAIGRAAVSAATEGKSGVMMTFVRVSDNPYRADIRAADIHDIANEVRCVPPAYINADGNGVTAACLSYLRPLILGEITPCFENGVPKHFVFR